MAQSTLEKELLERENRYWQAMKDKDVDAALAMTADPVILTGAQGVSKVTKDRFALMMGSGQWTMKDYELSDVQVQRLGRNVAVVAYKVTEDLTVEGQPVTLEASDASTWIRKDGEWLCALHTESVSGDPFGRDRQGAN
jgi:ketosteroid isomerase-like protein